MPIKFHCPHCSAAIKAPETHAGQTLPCPKCSQPVVVADEGTPPATPPAFPNIPEPEPIEEIPEIVTRDSRSYTAPPPLAPSPPGGNAFEAPQTPQGQVVDQTFQNIRIVDLNLPWKSVFKFAVQFFVCNMLLGFVLWVLMMLALAVLAAIGMSVGMA